MAEFELRDLPQIRLVEKWQARDGSFHDSREEAEDHQLKSELELALTVGQGYPNRQATHLLSHFDIVRKGDIPNGSYIATPQRPESSRFNFWSFFWGSTVTMVCGIAWLHFS